MGNISDKEGKNLKWKGEDNLLVLTVIKLMEPS
jgi:hypothetical protein